LRGRIESILDWATSLGYRQGENPARWRGHLKNLLPERTREPNHHSAIGYDHIADFMMDLRGRDGVAALALQFLVLTAARTGEVIGAQWSEIDLGKKLWVVPAKRMKAGKEHVVPLSDAAAVIFESMIKLCQGDFIFPSTREAKPLSNMSLLA